MEAEGIFRSGRGRGRGTPDCLVSLRRQVELAWAPSTPMGAAFVDFSKALDSVNEGLYEARVAGQGVKSKWINITP